jgi:hypothetical protein
MTKQRKDEDHDVDRGQQVLHKRSRSLPSISIRSTFSQSQVHAVSCSISSTDLNGSKNGTTAQPQPIGNSMGNDDLKKKTVFGKSSHEMFIGKPQQNSTISISVSAESYHQDHTQVLELSWFRWHISFRCPTDFSHLPMGCQPAISEHGPSRRPVLRDHGA